MLLDRALSLAIRNNMKHSLAKSGNMSSSSEAALSTMWEFEKRFGRVRAAERLIEGGCDVS